MINSIIESISISLNAEFGDEYTTYTESVEQGLNEPCFLRSALTPQTVYFLESGISGKTNSAYNTSPLIKTGQKKNVMQLPKGFFHALNISPLPGIWCVVRK